MINQAWVDPWKLIDKESIKPLEGGGCAADLTERGRRLQKHYIINWPESYSELGYVSFIVSRKWA